MRFSISLESSRANSSESAASSTSVVELSFGPIPGVEIGGASTRVLCRGRLPNGNDVADDVGNAVGGGADGAVLAGENLSRTSNKVELPRRKRILSIKSEESVLLVADEEWIWLTYRRGRRGLRPCLVVSFVTLVLWVVWTL